MRRPAASPAPGRGWDLRGRSSGLGVSESARPGAGGARTGQRPGGGAEAALGGARKGGGGGLR